MWVQLDSDGGGRADGECVTWHVVCHVSGVADWSAALGHASCRACSCVTCNLHGNCNILEITGLSQTKGKGRREGIALDGGGSDRRQCEGFQNGGSGKEMCGAECWIA
jgi:hypothetical protein